MERPPRRWLSNRFKQLVTYTTMPDGGHFAALEKPELLVPDVVNFIAKSEELYAQGKVITSSDS